MTTALKPDDDERESRAAYHAEIDRRLDQLRPKRASVSETDWRQPVYAWARNHMPNEATLVRDQAKRDVDVREGEATKRGNLYIRRYLKGQIPLEWALLGPSPIKVGRRLRVRLDAATPQDVEDAARLILAEGKATYDEVVLLAGGLLDLARDARQAGFTFVAEIGDLPLREDGRMADLGWDDEEDDDGLAGVPVA